MSGKEIDLPEGSMGDLRGAHQREVFEVLEKLGEGSFGSVWKARARSGPSAGELLAAKRIVIDVPAESGDGGEGASAEDAEAEAVAEVRREVAFISGCRSAYVEDYYGAFVEGRSLWLLMEYCACGSVRDLMAASDTVLDELQAATVLWHAARGLAFLHGRHKIHRDIKAGNILVTARGECKLADFGVAGSSDTRRYTTVGTPYWMAPEIVLEQGYGTAVDVWALANTAIELVDGRPPLADMNPLRAVFAIPTRPPPAPAAPVSPELAAFVAACLAKDPAARATADALLAHPFLQQVPTPPAGPDAPLAPLIQQQQAAFAAHGRARALELDQDTLDAVSQSLASATANFDFSTYYGSATGTTIITDDSTFVLHDS